MGREELDIPDPDQLENYDTESMWEGVHEGELRRYEEELDELCEDSEDGWGGV